jgi:dehydrogenase/reductase SDR family protein 12
MTWLDRALDASIVGSYGRGGFRRHARAFVDHPPRRLDGPVLVTGGTAGIGLAAVEGLTAAGLEVVLWGRDRARGAAVVAAGPRRTFAPVDLGDLDAVARASASVEGPLGGLVLNAGGMPTERTLSPQGHEGIWASQVLGHALLLRRLVEAGALAPTARVVWVSSGGMYTQALDLSDLRRDRGYERHVTYANAKRAQVMLSAAYAARWPALWTSAMHPGWVDTAGLAAGMPWFRRLTLPMLRDGAAGADTVVWLTLDPAPGPTGAFWFDRARHPVHLLARTRAGDHQLPALLALVDAATEPWMNR